MRTRFRWTPVTPRRDVSLLLLLGFSLGAIALAAGRSAPAAASAPAPVSASPTATCVFSNPGFAGKCQENVPVAAGSNEQKACESILQCLNDSRCTKTYCQATEIRTGWKLDSAKSSNSPR
jgi:hypothetical protein